MPLPQVDALRSANNQFHLTLSTSQSTVSAVGPQAGESEHVSPLRAISQFVTVCVFYGHEPFLFSKLDVLGTHFSGKGVKI